jgi:hypothetical protein
LPSGFERGDDALSVVAAAKIVDQRVPRLHGTTTTPSRIAMPTRSMRLGPAGSGVALSRGRVLRQGGRALRGAEGPVTRSRAVHYPGSAPAAFSRRSVAAGARRALTRGKRSAGPRSLPTRSGGSAPAWSTEQAPPKVKPVASNVRLSRVPILCDPAEARRGRPCDVFPLVIRDSLLHGAAPESNRPTDRLRRRTGFEDALSVSRGGRAVRRFSRFFVGRRDRVCDCGRLVLAVMAVPDRFI